MTWFWLGIAALVIGLSLGVMGAGGSILAVPLFMLLLGMPEKLAVQHALITVGSIALFGAIKEGRRQATHWRVLMVFALASLPMASVGAASGHLLPQGGQTLILILLLCIAAAKMLGHRERKKPQCVSFHRLWLAAGTTGFVTGVVGIGGGFLIVPALVLFAAIPMAMAVTMSLWLISANALLAYSTLFLLSSATLAIDWLVVGVVVVSGVSALVAGQSLAPSFPSHILKRGFGACLIVVAGMLFITQI